MYKQLKFSKYYNLEFENFEKKFVGRGEGEVAHFQQNLFESHMYHSLILGLC